MKSLTAEQQGEIDSLILAKSIIPGIGRIMEACGVGLVAARDLFKARYRQLRAERGAEFRCDDEEYWSYYGEDIFDAMAKDW